jgi:hypothetical protein
VLNKGWYVANVLIRYKVGAYDVVQRASLMIDQSVVFRVPYAVTLDGQTGVVVRADAVAGNNVMEVRVKSSPECIHIWGTTLGTQWSFINWPAC